MDTITKERRSLNMSKIRRTQLLWGAKFPGKNERGDSLERVPIFRSFFPC